LCVMQRSFKDIASSSVQTQTTRLTMQFSILILKPSLTVSRAKLAHWASELQTTCRVLASTRRMFHLQRPTCNFSLCCYDKTTTSPEVFKCKFFELRSEFSQHLEICTDGSKDGVRTAAAVVAPNSVKTVRLPDQWPHARWHKVHCSQRIP